jgi:MtN3 and saliva related transmembrane protein
MSFKQKISYEHYMFVVGILGQCLFFFQAYEIFYHQSARDVSLPGFTLGLISVSSWLVYGLRIKDRILITANAVACVGAFLVLFGIWLYG